MFSVLKCVSTSILSTMLVMENFMLCNTLLRLASFSKQFQRKLLSNEHHSWIRIYRVLFGLLVCWLLSFYLSIALHKKTLPQISLHLRGNFLTTISTIVGEMFLQQRNPRVLNFCFVVELINVYILWLPSICIAWP